MPPALTLYGIPNCDTVKRARQWLADQGVACTFHDFKKQGVDEAQLARWQAAVGWDKLLNRKGTMWRRLDEATQASVVDAASALAVMREHPSTIKRPVVEWPQGVCSVGFAPEVWETLRRAAP